MKCPSCGAADLQHDTRNMPYTYKGKSTIIENVTGDFCPKCNEAVFSLTQSKRYSKAMLAFIKQVNTAIIEPGFIARVRKKLELDQQEAAEIFGGGVNAFSRYETGKTNPPLALVKLLKMLERHPNLLNEIRSL